MKTLFHFIIPEKISQNIICNFDSLDVQNIYFIFNSNRKIDEFHLNSESGTIIVLNQNTKLDLNEESKKCCPKFLFLHSFHPSFYNIVANFKKEKLGCEIIWLPWGYDIYTLPKFSLQNYAPQTYHFYKTQYRIKFCLQLIKSLIPLPFFKFLIPLSSIAKSDAAFKKVDSICTYILEDYNTFIKHYSYDIQFLYSPFLSLDQYVVGFNKEQWSRKTFNRDIIIGNSLSLESNYLDVIDYLEQYKCHFSELYFMTSYGNNQIYFDEITKRTKLKIGFNVQFQTNFIHPKKYVNFLEKFNTAIFFHYRQQGMGNIIIMLFLGYRIYLSEKNSVFNFFRRKGLNVFSLESDFKTFGTSPMSDENIKSNKEAVEKIFSKEHLTDSLKNIVFKNDL